MIAEPEVKKTAGREEESHEMINKLNNSFEMFIGITEDLREAYDSLRERADAMDLKLEDANHSLSEKVRELDGMTRRLNGLLQSLPSAVVAVDRHDRVIHFNRAAEMMLNMRSEDLFGKKLESVEGIEDLLLLCRDPKDGTCGDVENERTIMTRGNRRLVVTSRISQFKDAAGNHAGRIEILTDLTETDRLRREVHHLDTLAAMGEMAAEVAHQIRNPLNGVEGFASLLKRSIVRKDAGGKDPAGYAGKVVEGVREVNAIINSMLLLARKGRIEPEPVDLNAIAKDTVEELRSAAQSRGIDADIRWKKENRAEWVAGDALKLKQACLNIGFNALESLTPEKCSSIRISVNRSGNKVRFRVTDSGVGMDKETASKVFRPFFTTRNRGTGLGLPVAAKIVDLHNGCLSVRSISSVGTAFKMELNRLDRREE